MRRSTTSRRRCRGVVPSRSAASSNVISLSILAILLLLCGGHGGQLLAGHRSLFAGTSRGRQGQPALPLGLIARAHVHPGRNDDYGLVVLGSTPRIQGHVVASPPSLGEGDPGPAQDTEGGRVAAALGRPVPTEPQHVRPSPQPQPLQLGTATQL